MYMPFRRPTRSVPACLAILATFAAVPAGSAAQELAIPRFEAATSPLSRDSLVEGPSLYFRSTAGSAIGMGLSLAVAHAMMPRDALVDTYFEILLNGLVVGTLASTAGAVIGARSAATEERPISTGRAIGGAALGILPAYAAGVLGGIVGSLGGAPGTAGFVVGYALAQGAFTTLAAPPRR